MQLLDTNTSEQRTECTDMNNAETDRVRKMNTEQHRVPARARHGTDMMQGGTDSVQYTATGRNTAEYGT